VAEIPCRPERSNNLFRRPYGGAIYALIDEVFKTAAQRGGAVRVALNVNVSWITSPEPEDRLGAEARMISRTSKTAGYEIRVPDAQNKLIATCRALAYRTGKPLPFMQA